MTGRFQLALLLFLPIFIAGCGSAPSVQDGAPAAALNPHTIPDAKPRYLPKSRYGNPDSYVVFGKRYFVLKTAKGYDKRGIASWYGTKFHGRLTSSREPYNLYGMTAASPELPIPCFVRVTNLANGRSIIVKVNDRGPFAPNRIIDLSYAGATKLGYLKKGTAMVEVQAIDVNNPYSTSPVRLAQTPKLYLQLGAFSDPLNAENLKGRIQDYTSAKVRIKDGEYRDAPIYRVQIGPLKGVGESDKLQALLKRDGLGTAITVIR